MSRFADLLRDCTHHWTHRDDEKREFWHCHNCGAISDDGGDTVSVLVDSGWGNEELVHIDGASIEDGEIVFE